MDSINRVNLEQIASFASAEIGIDRDTVLRVYNSQFAFIANHIKDGKKQTIKLDYFGKFMKNVYLRKRG